MFHIPRDEVRIDDVLRRTGIVSELSDEIKNRNIVYWVLFSEETDTKSLNS